MLVVQPHIFQSLPDVPDTEKLMNKEFCGAYGLQRVVRAGPTTDRIYSHATLATINRTDGRAGQP